MGIKKIARPMNKTKNAFVKWLKKNKATNIDICYKNDSHWDYHCHIYAFLKLTEN